MFRKTLITVLLVVVCCTSLGWASDADYYITVGRQLMFDGTLSGLRLAYETFDNGLKDPACPDCNTSRELKFWRAVTGTTMLVFRNDNGSIDSVLELARQFDIEVLGDCWAPYWESLRLDFELALNQYDAYEIPAGAPDAIEVRDIIDTSMIPKIEAIIADLNSISDEPNDRFQIFLEPEETSILFDPNSPGLQNAVEVDYGEVLILKGFLLALKVQLEARSAYDMYIDENAMLAEKIYGESFHINADLLDPYPDFLKVLPTANDSNDGAAVLAQTRQDWIDAINYYLDAVDYIRNEEDWQGDDLLYIDPNDDFLVDMVNENLITLRDSLQNDTVMTYQLETNKTYDIYDVNSAPIGQLVLVYDFIDIEGDDGSLTFTDSNLAPSPWDIEWFCKEDATLIEIELEYHSDSEWRQGWFEGTLSDDGNSITDGTLEWWGSVVSCTATFYEVWGGNTYYGDQPNSWEYYYNINQQDYTKLGESDGQTATFPGDYNFYVIAAREEFFLDSVQGSTDDYYYGGLSTGNTSDPQNILGPPDDQYAIVGYQSSGETFRGFVVITNPGNWTSITVISDRVCAPDVPESPLSGLSGQLVSTEVVEETNIELNPVFGSSTRYPDPVNLRDLLPVFDEWNAAQPDTVGHGLGDDATLGGITPDMSQYDWQVLFDLQPSGLFYLDLISPSQIQIDGEVDDWTVDQLIFADISGDTEEDYNDIKGVDIKDVYMAYDFENVYGAISLNDPVTDPNQSRAYILMLSYSPDNPSTLDSLRFDFYASRDYLDGQLYHITYDEWGRLRPQYITDLDCAFGQNAVEFKVPFADIPSDLYGRFISVNSWGPDPDWYRYDGEENLTHLRMGAVGTISGTITYSGYRGAPIFIQAYTDPDDPEESLVAGTTILEPGPYTLDGIGLGWQGYVRAFTPLFGFNVFDLEALAIEATVSVLMFNTDVDGVDIVLNNPPILKKDIWVFEEIDTSLNKEDWYAFDAVRGGTYTLDFNRLTSQYASMTLFGRDGHTDIEELYYWQVQQINWLCPLSGRYYVKVEDTNYQPEGGTYEIRMTSDLTCPDADIACADWVGVKDCKVDFYDLTVLISQWLDSCSEPYWCDESDFDQSRSIDFADFALMANEWLQDGTP